MRTSLNKAKAALTRQLPIPLILLIGVIGVQTITSCSSGGDGNGDDNGGGGKGNNIVNYRTKRIGEQVWMAENLNYAVPGSKCNGEGGNVIVDWGTDDNKDNPIYKTLSNAEIQANCDKYGRLYDWSTAMALPSSCNSTSCSSQIDEKHKGICPSGWHIPSNADWDKLVRYADGTSGTDSPYDSPTAGRYLKAASGWSGGGNGEDKYGFSALPGGGGYPDGSFYTVGGEGHWWSASEGDASSAYIRRMNDYNERVRCNYYYDDRGKGSLFSVRCVQD